MNDIAKERISDKLIESLEKERISKNQAGPLLGIKSPYLSLVTVRAHWKGCPESGWDALQKWVNSGQGIVEYSQKRGHVLPQEKVKERHEAKLLNEILKEPKPDAIPKAELPDEQLRVKGKPLTMADIINVPQSQKVVIDIEINLIVNGVKIKLG